MKLLRPPIAHPRSGVALMCSVFLAFAAFSSAFVFVTLANSANKLSDARTEKTRADYLARAGTVRATESIYAALSSMDRAPTAGQTTVDGVTVDYTIDMTVDQNPESLDSGLNSLTSVYRIRSRVQVGNQQSEARTVVRADEVPMFQFAMFYEGDMYFIYPATMNIRGRVHCNGDMYVHAQNGIDFDTNYLRISGGYYGRPKWDYWTSSIYNWGAAKSFRVRNWVEDPFDPLEPVTYTEVPTTTEMAALGAVTTGGFDSDFAGLDLNADMDFDDFGEIEPFGPGALDRWKAPALYPDPAERATFMTGEHGVQNVDVPEIDDFRMFTPAANSDGDYEWDAGQGEYVQVASGTGTHDKGPMYEQADLSIITKSDGSWKAFNASGIEVTGDLAGVVTPGTLFDARQAEGSGQSIQATTIDMAALNSSGRFPKNGLLYVAGYGSGTGTNVKGFKLTKASELADDLNVVSPDSLYLHGDYNTVNSKSSGVMADAVNLLSNAWDDTKASGSLPSASSTRYVTSLLTGDTAAAEKSFNGGPQNLPRFHEKWSSKTCTIEGSMVCLGHSERATGQFVVGGDWYKPPTRNWSYDDRLNNWNNLPPFTPRYVDVTSLVAW